MFKYIIIFTLYYSPEEIQILQIDGMKSYLSEDQCRKDLAETMTRFSNKATEENRKYDFNLNECFFIKALGKDISSL